MKIPNKRELQQIAFNHSSDIDFLDFINLYKKFTVESYSFLLIDNTLLSDNSLCFRKNLLETIQKLIMKIDDKIRYGKLQYHIYREVAKWVLNRWRNIAVWSKWNNRTSKVYIFPSCEVFEKQI